MEIEHKDLTHAKHTPALGQDLKSRKELKWIKQLYQKGQRSWVLSDAGCLRTEGIIALEEGLCRAVESGGPILRSEDANQALASQERKGLHLQNKGSPWEVGTGDKVTGSQHGGDSLLCRGHRGCHRVGPAALVRQLLQYLKETSLACEGLRVGFSPAWKTGPYLLCWEVKMVLSQGIPAAFL